MKITNLLKITEEDTIGSAIIKGAATAYVKTTVTGLIGLGVITVGVITLTNMKEPEEEKEVEMTPEDEEYEGLVDISDELKKSFDELEKQMQESVNNS